MLRTLLVSKTTKYSGLGLLSKHKSILFCCFCDKKVQGRSERDTAAIAKKKSKIREYIKKVGEISSCELFGDDKKLRIILEFDQKNLAQIKELRDLRAQLVKERKYLKRRLKSGKPVPKQSVKRSQADTKSNRPYSIRVSKSLHSFRDNADNDDPIAPYKQFFDGLKDMPTNTASSDSKNNEPSLNKLPTESGDERGTVGFSQRSRSDELQSKPQESIKNGSADCNSNSSLQKKESVGFKQRRNLEPDNVQSATMMETMNSNKNTIYTQRKQSPKPDEVQSTVTPMVNQSPSRNAVLPKTQNEIYSNSNDGLTHSEPKKRIPTYRIKQSWNSDVGHSKSLKTSDGLNKSPTVNSKRSIRSKDNKQNLSDYIQSRKKPSKKKPNSNNNFRQRDSDEIQISKSLEKNQRYASDYSNKSLKSDTIRRNQSEEHRHRSSNSVNPNQSYARETSVNKDEIQTPKKLKSNQGYSRDDYIQNPIDELQSQKLMRKRSNQRDDSNHSRRDEIPSTPNDYVTQTPRHEIQSPIKRNPKRKHQNDDLGYNSTNQAQSSRKLNPNTNTSSDYVKQSPRDEEQSRKIPKDIGKGEEQSSLNRNNNNSSDNYNKSRRESNRSNQSDESVQRRRDEVQFSNTLNRSGDPKNIPRDELSNRRNQKANAPSDYDEQRQYDELQPSKNLKHSTRDEVKSQNAVTPSRKTQSDYRNQSPRNVAQSSKRRSQKQRNDLKDGTRDEVLIPNTFDSKRSSTNDYFEQNHRDEVQSPNTVYQDLEQSSFDDSRSSHTKNQSSTNRSDNFRDSSRDEMTDDTFDSNRNFPNDHVEQIRRDERQFQELPNYSSRDELLPHRNNSSDNVKQGDRNEVRSPNPLNTNKNTPSDYNEQSERDKSRSLKTHQDDARNEVHFQNDKHQTQRPPSDYGNQSPRDARKSHSSKQSSRSNDLEQDFRDKVQSRPRDYVDQIHRDEVQSPNTKHQDFEPRPRDDQQSANPPSQSQSSNDYYEKLSSRDEFESPDPQKQNPTEDIQSFNLKQKTPSDYVKQGRRDEVQLPKTITPKRRNQSDDLKRSFKNQVKSPNELNHNRVPPSDDMRQRFSDEVPYPKQDDIRPRSRDHVQPRKRQSSPKRSNKSDDLKPKFKDEDQPPNTNNRNRSPPRDYTRQVSRDEVPLPNMPNPKESDRSPDNKHIVMDEVLPHKTLTPKRDNQSVDLNRNFKEVQPTTPNRMRSSPSEDTRQNLKDEVQPKVMPHPKESNRSDNVRQSPKDEIESPNTLTARRHDEIDDVDRNFKDEVRPPNTFKENRGPPKDDVKKSFGDKVASPNTSSTSPNKGDDVKSSPQDELHPQKVLTPKPSNKSHDLKRNIADSVQTPNTPNRNRNSSKDSIRKSPRDEILLPNTLHPKESNKNHPVTPSPKDEVQPQKTQIPKRSNQSDDLKRNFNEESQSQNTLNRKRNLPNDSIKQNSRDETQSRNALNQKQKNRTDDGKHSSSDMTQSSNTLTTNSKTALEHVDQKPKPTIQSEIKSDGTQSFESQKKTESNEVKQNLSKKLVTPITLSSKQTNRSNAIKKPEIKKPTVKKISSAVDDEMKNPNDIISEIFPNPRDESVKDPKSSNKWKLHREEIAKKWTIPKKKPKKRELTTDDVWHEPNMDSVPSYVSKRAKKIKEKRDKNKSFEVAVITSEQKWTDPKKRQELASKIDSEGYWNKQRTLPVKNKQNTKTEEETTPDPYTISNQPVESRMKQKLTKPIRLTPINEDKTYPVFEEDRESVDAFFEKLVDQPEVKALKAKISEKISETSTKRPSQKKIKKSKRESKDEPWKAKTLTIQPEERRFRTERRLDPEYPEDTNSVHSFNIQDDFQKQNSEEQTKESTAPVTQQTNKDKGQSTSKKQSGSQSHEDVQFQIKQQVHKKILHQKLQQKLKLQQELTNPSGAPRMSNESETETTMCLSREKCIEDMEDCAKRFLFSVERFVDSFNDDASNPENTITSGPKKSPN